jgi:hypothetical protein
MERKIFYIVIFIFSIVVVSCKKKENNDVYTPVVADDIRSYDVNKMITATGSDSIIMSCWYSIFSIEHSPDSTSSDTLAAFLKMPENPGEGDCGLAYQVEPSDSDVKVLSENEVISHTNLFNSGFYHPLNLRNFRGQGIKYIGFDICSTYSTLCYYYGWIKIELSSDCDSLKIYSFALNNTKNMEIKAGQTQ